MDQSANEIWNIINSIDLDILQFHGDESVDYCKQFNKPFIKTLHINKKLLNSDSTYENFADYFLIDTSINGKHGGTGSKFDWNLLSDDKSITKIIENHSCFIAGGLDINNIGDLISQHKPYGIDVSSGLESSMGKKDHLLMKKFLENVRISEKENYEKN
jgi:phosphoribosylanthranilate isomerase